MVAMKCEDANQERRLFFKINAQLSTQTSQMSSKKGFMVILDHIMHNGKEYDWKSQHEVITPYLTTLIVKFWW